MNIFIAFLLLFARAEDTPTKKLVSFEAFVQFAEGSVSLEQDLVKYGTPIYEDSKIKLEKNAALKFVTRQNCIVVAYGDGVVTGPLAEKPWRIATKAARFICSEKSEEKFLFHGVEIIPQGETLFEASGKIFVVTGSARLGSVLSSRRIYQYSKNIAVADSNQNAQTQFDFDNLYKVPREGEKLQKPKVTKNNPDKYRVSFGPEFGPAILIHANSSLNHYDYSSNGPHLQYTFRNDLAGIILGLHYLETESQNHGNNYGSQSSSSANDRLKTLGFDVGYRFDFDRWWSPFVKGGATWASNELNINSNTCNNCSGYYSDQTFDYWGVSASLGLDALVRPSWLGGLGIFASAEVELNQTLFSSKQKVNNLQDNGSAPHEADNDKGFILNFNGLVNLGLMYQW